MKVKIIQFFLILIAIFIFIYAIVKAVLEYNLARQKLVLDHDAKIKLIEVSNNKVAQTGFLSFLKDKFLEIIQIIMNL